MEATLPQVRPLQRTAARRKEDPDARAVERVLDGDAAAFGELVQSHQQGLYYLCLRYVRHDEDAADLTQRAFLRAYEKLGSFGGRAAFRTWLYRIAVNLCLNAIRDRDRRPTVGLEPDTGAVEAGQHDAVDRSQRRRRLRAAVDKLPPKQRMTVILRVYHELPFSEVAEIMDNSVGSAKVNYHHAMKRLQALVEDDER